MSKYENEFLASCLKEKCLLRDDVCITPFIKGNNYMIFFFLVDGPLSFCNNIDELFHGFGQERVPSEWRLLIDSSKRSLKAVLINNDNKKMHSQSTFNSSWRSDYENIQVLLDSIKHLEYMWKLKVDWNIDGTTAGIDEILPFLCLSTLDAVKVSPVWMLWTENL